MRLKQYLTEDKIEKAKEILLKIDQSKRSGHTKGDRRHTAHLILLNLKPQLEKLKLSKSEIDFLVKWKEKEGLK